jgi:putative addiction module antidote
MLKLKLTQIGNSVGLILPKEVLTLLKVEKGDSVFVTETPEGVTISPYDTSVEEQLKLGREIMREYRDTLRILAK